MKQNQEQRAKAEQIHHAKRPKIDPGSFVLAKDMITELHKVCNPSEQQIKEMCEIK